jgi:hypothetical protein
MTFPIHKLTGLIACPGKYGKELLLFNHLNWGADSCRDG